MGKPEEKDDLAIVEVFFGGRQLQAESFTPQEMQAGKTPDFKIRNAAGIVAFCEVKSPQDIFNERVNDAINQADGKIAGVIRHRFESRQYVCLERFAKKAATQFDAVNPTHSVPNILMIVNHDRHTKCHDFVEVLTGYFQGIQTGHPLRDGIPQIDVYIWVDGNSGKVIERIFRHENPLKETARALLELD